MKEYTGRGWSEGNISELTCLQNPALATGFVLCCRKDTGLEWTFLLFSTAVLFSVRNYLFLSLFSSLILPVALLGLSHVA